MSLPRLNLPNISTVSAPPSTAAALESARTHLAANAPATKGAPACPRVALLRWTVYDPAVDEVRTILVESVVPYDEEHHLMLGTKHRLAMGVPYDHLGLIDRTRVEFLARVSVQVRGETSADVLRIAGADFESLCALGGALVEHEARHFRRAVGDGASGAIISSVVAPWAAAPVASGG